MKIQLSRFRTEKWSRYVAVLSIDLELTGDGSALGVQKPAMFVKLCQTAHANGARVRSRGAA
jgi:hypothetical protein